MSTSKESFTQPLEEGAKVIYSCPPRQFKMSHLILTPHCYLFSHPQIRKIQDPQKKLSQKVAMQNLLHCSEIL